MLVDFDAYANTESLTLFEEGQANPFIHTRGAIACAPSLLPPAFPVYDITRSMEQPTALEAWIFYGERGTLTMYFNYSSPKQSMLDERDTPPLLRLHMGQLARSVAWSFNSMFPYANTLNRAQSTNGAQISATLAQTTPEDIIYTPDRAIREVNRMASIIRAGIERLSMENGKTKMSWLEDLDRYA